MASLKKKFYEIYNKTSFIYSLNGRNSKKLTVIKKLSVCCYVIIYVNRINQLEAVFSNILLTVGQDDEYILYSVTTLHESKVVVQQKDISI